MALETWNGRTASQVDADSPLDTTLMDGLRKDLDHLRQVLYGSTDPSFHTPAWGHDHDGTNSKLVVLASQTVGNYLLVANPDERTTVSDSYVKLKEIKVGVSGTFRIKFSLHEEIGAGSTVYGQIYRNGSAVGTERSNSSDTYIEYSEDIGGWTAGDLVQIYGKAPSGNPGYYAYIKDFNIYTAAPPIGGELYGY